MPGRFEVMKSGLHWEIPGESLGGFRFHFFFFFSKLETGITPLIN